MLKKKIEELNKKYEELMHQINLEKANGNLSKLYNLKNEFDETFDHFFDDEDIRQKYDSDFEKSNNEILEMLDSEDLKSYIEFYENYIEQLDDKLTVLKS